MITATDEVAAALAAAAVRWPGLTPSELLRRLVTEGHAALRTADEAERAAVEETRGALTGVYQPGYLDELRQGWSA